LITQRLLKAALTGACEPYTNEELKDLGQQCTLEGGGKINKPDF
jgi:hypothetical protein